MKLTALAATVVMAAGAAPADRTVTVCMQSAMAFGPAAQAKMIASKIFAAIEVTIDWRSDRACPSEGIVVALTGNTPQNFRPGALAYAMPYEGTHIRLFYDRISQGREHALVPILLAHVLVHEITHILEGINCHSSSGIMKARWDEKDFSEMAWKPLPFADEDVELIRQGLAGRAARAMVAMNAAPAVAAQ